ncbi:hypothetical protein GCM10009588_18900 [Microbacterium phyllosphaerae]
MRQAVTVSCATDVAAPNSCVSAGSAGRYRSMEIGPNTVSTSKSAGSIRLIFGCVAEEVMHTSVLLPADRRESLVRGVLTGNPSRDVSLAE